MTDDKMREAFEAMCTKRWRGDRGALVVRADGEYENGNVQFGWVCWQAAAAQQAQEIEALRADAERYKLTLEKIAGISRYKYSTDWSAVIAAMMMADEVLAVKAKP